MNRMGADAINVSSCHEILPARDGLIFHNRASHAIHFTALSHNHQRRRERRLHRRRRDRPHRLHQIVCRRAVETRGTLEARAHGRRVAAIVHCGGHATVERDAAPAVAARRQARARRPTHNRQHATPSTPTVPRTGLKTKEPR